MQPVQVQHDTRNADLLVCPHRIAQLLMSSFHCRLYIPLEYNLFPVQYAIGRETDYFRVLELEYKLRISKTEFSNILSLKKK